MYDSPSARLARLERKHQWNHAVVVPQAPQTIFALHHAGDPFAQGERVLVKVFDLEAGLNQRVEDFAQAMVPIVAVQWRAGFGGVGTLCLEVKGFFRHSTTADWIVDNCP